MNHQAAVPRTVHFDIGHITLHGYSPGQRTRFARSLQACLTELGTGHGQDWPAPGQQRIGHLDAGLLRAGAPPEEAARRVAAEVLAAVAGRAGRDGGAGERHE